MIAKLINRLYCTTFIMDFFQYFTKISSFYFKSFKPCFNRKIKETKTGLVKFMSAHSKTFLTITHKHTSKCCTHSLCFFCNTKNLLYFATSYEMHSFFIR